MVLDIIHLGGSGIFGLDIYLRRDFQKSQFGSVYAGDFGILGFYLYLRGDFQKSKLGFVYAGLFGAFDQNQHEDETKGDGDFAGKNRPAGDGSKDSF